MGKLTNRLKTVNLLWNKTIKGILPLSTYSVNSEGKCTIIRPDELRSRTYHMERIDSTGNTQKVGTFNLETIRKIVTSANIECLATITDNDLIYLLSEDLKKSRLPKGSAGLHYEDLTISADGSRLAFIFFEFYLGNSLLCLCDNLGKELWSTVLEDRGRKLAISPEGDLIAISTEGNRILLFNSQRNLIWSLSKETPITGVGITAEGKSVVASTSDGELIILDSKGSLSWHYQLPTQIIGLAIAVNSGVVASVHHLPDSGTCISYFNNTGRLLWEYEVKREFNSLSLSPDGKYLATTTKDGQICLFEVLFKPSDEIATAEAKKYYDLGIQCCQKGELNNAYEWLKKCLHLNPLDSNDCTSLREVQSQLLTQGYQQALQQFEQGEYKTCIATLKTIVQINPLDPQIPNLLLKAYKKQIESLLQRGLQYYQQGELDKALAEFQAILEIEFTHAQAREYLAKIYQYKAQEIFKQGLACFQKADYAQALLKFEEALGLDLSIEGIQDYINKAQTELYYKKGMEYYEQGKYVEAAFELRKALELDPTHQQAQKYLQYAKNFLSDKLISERFTKLE